MMRKLISWLSFMMAFCLLLLSCVHDEIYTPSEKERQGIVSKSLWKEDTLFIHRIYDHFGKSFIPSAEKKEAFISEYGTPAWEYAMTMGFGKNQLYFPVIKNGRVHGMIRVLRQDRQASYSFTQDREALDFFETVIYNPRNCHLKPQKDEKTGTANSAKAGGYTWKCTKRIVTTGWHMDGETMVLETALVESCKYTYTGMNPAVDHLEVATDGMESGGGDDEGEEYEGSPCEKIKTKFADSRIRNQFNALNTQANFNKDHEEAFYEKSTMTNGFVVQSFIPVSGPQCSDYIDLPSVKTGITGFGHTHNNYGCDGRASILVPSPEDLMVFLYTMVKQAGNIYGDYSKAYYFTVTSGGNYMFQYSGSISPQNLTFDINKLSDEYKEVFDNLKSRYSDMPQNKVEETFTKFLKEKVNIEGLEIYKVTTDSSERLEYDFNTKTLARIPCPTV